MNKKIGLGLIIAPFAGILIAIIGFSISAIIVSSSGVNIFTSLLNWVFWFVGLLSVVAGLILIPVGILWLRRVHKKEREIVEGVSYDVRSGSGKNSIIPDEIKGWNWGAAGLTWIWGVYHGVWISLLTFIPFVNIIMWIILGLKGSEWEWKAEKWKNTEEFLASQKKWKPWGIVFFILGVVALIMNLLK